MPTARTRLQNAVEMLGVPAHQLAAAAAPHRRIRDLVDVGLSTGGQSVAGADEDEEIEGKRSIGNFNDLQALLDNFTSMPVFELGKPLPSDKYLPRRRVGSCPAAHNRELLGKLRR